MKRGRLAAARLGRISLRSSASFQRSSLLEHEEQFGMIPSHYAYGSHIGHLEAPNAALPGISSAVHKTSVIPMLMRLATTKKPTAYLCT